MSQKVYYSLYDRMLNKRNLYEAFKQVKASKGTGGIDRQDIGDFESNIKQELSLLESELRDKSYKPLPVKRVEIPKEKGKVRKLGIPSVRDRVVQQTLLNILQPIYEEDFHPSSYGYRPKRSCHSAISKASLFMRRYELNHVVDMDLSQFFDRIDHELLIKLMRKRVTDGSILNLIKSFLKSGVMIGRKFEPTELGSPQGGVISPLLANIYLNEFDWFMKNKGYRIVRYADDILILCASPRSAKKAREVASDYLESVLKLKVNTEKTHVTSLGEGVRFLGVTIFENYTLIQDKKLHEFKKKVKTLTKRSQGMNLEMVINRLNPLLRGFTNYFRIANCKGVFSKMMSWIRRRLRAIQLKLWKKPRRLHRRLRQMGYRSSFCLIKMTSWRNSASNQANYAMPNKWFEELGLFNLESIITGIIVPC